MAAHVVFERRVDSVIHMVALVLALPAVWLLMSSLGGGPSIKRLASAGLYGFGLLGMLSASAAYNMARPGTAKAILRRLDHAMIFVMIAGSYTPFLLLALRPALAAPLCAGVWALALVGVAAKLTYPGRYERVFVGLYVAMAWLILGVGPLLVAVVPAAILWLVLAGSVVYTVGAVIYAYGKIPFTKLIWHGMVLSAAGLHFAAVYALCGVMPG